MFEWITSVVEQSGYLGVALLMFIENVFPPIPSELIMPLAGFTAARGKLAFLPLVAAGTAGSLAGALLWYQLGRWYSLARLRCLAARHGRWLTLTPEDVDKADAWFTRHGAKAVLIGRLVPGVRTLISVPAGINVMPFGRLLAYSALGTSLWTSLLAAAGYLLQERYALVEDWLNPVSNLVLLTIAGLYAYRVATHGRRSGPRGQC